VTNLLKEGSYERLADTDPDKQKDSRETDDVEGTTGVDINKKSLRTKADAT
jgi:hypothetical protein